MVSWVWSERQSSADLGVCQSEMNREGNDAMSRSLKLLVFAEPRATQELGVSPTCSDIAEPLISSRFKHRSI